MVGSVFFLEDFFCPKDLSGRVGLAREAMSSWLDAQRSSGLWVLTQRSGEILQGFSEVVQGEGGTWTQEE